MEPNLLQPIVRSTADTEELLEKASKDDQLASLLASGHRHAEAARVAGCSRSTVTRLLRDPAFVGRISAFRRERVHGLIGSMADQLPKVMGRLVELATGPNPHVTVIKAGIALMSVAPAYFKLGDHIDRADRKERLDALDEAGTTPA